MLTGYQLDGGDVYHGSQRRLSWQPDADDETPVGEIRQFLDVKTEAKLWKSLEDLSKPDTASSTEKSFRDLKCKRGKKSAKKQNLCRQEAFPSQESLNLGEGGLRARSLGEGGLRARSLGEGGLRARSLVLTGKTRRLVVNRNQNHTNSTPHLYQTNFAAVRTSASVSIAVDTEMCIIFFLSLSDVANFD